MEPLQAYVGSCPRQAKENAIRIDPAMGQRQAAAPADRRPEDLSNHCPIGGKVKQLQASCLRSASGRPCQHSL